MPSADVVAAIALMAIASYACRIGGYVLMRYVGLTARTQAWLNAIPIALMGAILGPVAAKGGVPEWAGMATAIVTMRSTGSEFGSALAAIVVVAILRAAGAS